MENKSLQELILVPPKIHMSLAEAGKVLALVKAGDARALDRYKQFGAHFGNLINTALFAYAPEAIFLGGSIS